MIWNKVRSVALTVSALLFALALLLIVEQVAQAVLRSEQASENEQNDADVLETCRSTIDRNYVTDEKGRVCTWLNVDYRTGCCPIPETETAPLAKFSCYLCTHNCCSIYAYCVSCCLNPTNAQGPLSPKFKDTFDFCLATCRTSSLSVINEKEWKSSLKYCYRKDGGVASSTGVHASVADNIESYPREGTTSSSKSASFPDNLSGDPESENRSSTDLNRGKPTPPNITTTSEHREASELASLKDKLAALAQENQRLSNQLEEHKREAERLAVQLEVLTRPIRITSANNTMEEAPETTLDLVSSASVDRQHLWVLLASMLLVHKLG